MRHMDISWLSIYFLIFAWTAALHVYAPPEPALCCLLSAAALLSAYLEQRRAERDGPFVRTSVFILLLLVAQLLLFPFYRMLAARFHEESFFASAAGLLLRICGIRAVSQGCMLYIDGLLGTTALLSTWEKVGVLYLILFLVAGFLNLRFKRAGAWQYALFAVLCLACTLLRYVFLLALYTAYGISGIFWDRMMTLLSFAPLPLFLSARFSHLPPAASLPLPSLGRLRGAGKREFAVSALCSFLLVFFTAAFFGLRDPGREKAGRVLVDEYHSDWEWTTEKYDEAWFGERSGYNYYCFYDCLDHFFEAGRNTEPVTAATLKEWDVYIVKTPTRAFSDAEVGYIREFVESGGGLYLIGDHTNVFGTGGNINALAEEFGLHFNYDSTYELTGGNLSEYDAPKLLPHPLVSGLPHFLFATSDTLKAKWQAEEIMIGYGLNCAPADYSQDNFFPEDAQAPVNSFGCFLQCAGVYHKKGRVLAFTDSTVFSNFWMYMPGKPELLLRSAAWLNRENRFPMAPRELALGCTLGILLLNLICLALRKERFLPEAYFAGSAAALLAAALSFQLLPGAVLTEPKPRSSVTKICFEQEYSRAAIPDSLAGFMAETKEKLDTFYVWTQRIGCMPCVRKSLAEGLADSKGGLVVIAKPSRELRDSKKILSCVSEGARVLILDNMAEGGHSNTFLRELGLELKEKEMAAYADYGELEGIALSADASAVLGGKALIEDRNGNALCAVKEYEDGLVAVFSDPDLFYNAALGDVSANLNERTELLSRVEFKLLKELLDL